MRGGRQAKKAGRGDNSHSRQAWAGGGADEKKRRHWMGRRLAFAAGDGRVRPRLVRGSGVAPAYASASIAGAYRSSQCAYGAGSTHDGRSTPSFFAA